MPKTIAIASNKGGVGKTTTSLNLAHGLTARGKAVLLVDLDGQCNSTRQYGAVTDGVLTVYDLLTAKDADARAAVQSHETYGDIVPGDILMVRAAEQMTALDSREYMLADALGKVSGGYDFVIIDCPPALDIIVKNALIAADAVVVPMLCDGYAVDSFENIMAQVCAIRSNRRLNPALTVAGILLTQFAGRTKLASSFGAQLPALAAESGTRVFDTRIRPCIKVREAATARVPLQEYARDCTAALDYDAFVEEFLDACCGNAQRYVASA